MRDALKGSFYKENVCYFFLLGHPMNLWPPRLPLVEFVAKLLLLLEASYVQPRHCTFLPNKLGKSKGLYDLSSWSWTTILLSSMDTLFLQVAHNTAISLSRRSRNLRSLDMSWCRNLTNEAVGLIVDSCLSLKMLKLFGCTQVGFQL